MPLAILKNLDGSPIQTLGYAFNLQTKLCYNEVSEFSFDLPAFVNGNKVPGYEDVVGMRIVDLQNVGQFILVNPSTSADGIKEIKHCKAYSLEYEFTYKKLSLEKSTYNFWNPVSRKDTVLGIIMDRMPSWSVGDVDSSLVGKYRTFEETDVNLYNFIKSTVQKTYNCIFDFDTYNRKVHVRDVGSKVNTSPVFMSLNNLIKEINIEEDTENIFTCLDVNGAEGVHIRSVNPMGINKIYNLDYFMNTKNFSDGIIEKWGSWKRTYESYQQTYFDLTVESILQTARRITETAALTELQNDLKSLENKKAVYIQAIAQGINKQNDLDDINRDIRRKKEDIEDQEYLIGLTKNDFYDLNSELIKTNNITAIENYFTSAEYLLLDRYIKEDSIEESSFVEATVQSYNTAGIGNRIAGHEFVISSSNVTKINHTHFEKKDLYAIRGGDLLCSNLNLNANIVRASFERNADRTFVFTAYLNRGNIFGDNILSGCISLTGTCSSLQDNTVPDEEAPEAYANGSSLRFTVSSGYCYFTRNTSEYEQRSVEWDLFEYGTDILNKLCYPSYQFSIEAANFLALDDFVQFKNKLRLGDKIYLELEEGKILEPIVIGLEIDFENPEKLSIHFGDKYAMSNSEFSLVDLLDQSISMGKKVDFSKYNYSAFVDSGTSTTVKDFMSSALDVSKNAVLSSTGQAISWDDSGIRLRQWKDDSQTDYMDEQIWMINNNIVFSSDGFHTAKMAIGKFEDDNAGSCWGIVAPNIVGTLLAGNNLIIESEKKDGGVSVFRVDGNGASLHNATFDIYGANTQITLNPYSGFALGDYPLYSGDEYTINERNAKLWVDMNGNLKIKGTLEAADGVFSGKLEAATGHFHGIVQAEDFQDKYGNSMLTRDLKIDPDYLELRGLRVYDRNDNVTLEIKSNGSIWMEGDINMTGGSISWANINEYDSDSYQLANDAYWYADDAWDTARDATRTANNAISDINRLADGRYSGTFIDGKKIISPIIQTNLLVITTPNDNRYESGLLLEGYFDNIPYEMLKISYYNNRNSPHVYFSSPCSAFAHWNFSYSYFYGHIDFSSADVYGLTASFA